MPELRAGTDAGKAAHHCTVIDTDGTKVLSRRVPNNEPELLELVSDVLWWQMGIARVGAIAVLQKCLARRVGPR
ncbi:MULTISPECIES: transposase [unclassified Streptomyces]|uniref:IS110 family transposase n=1 Tax=unclassified Streptomyces TaxID=2593676 RepID=UPI00344FA680